MSAATDQQTDPHGDQQGEARRYRVSRNRGAARHRVRYVESGGAIDTEDGCPLCKAEPEPEPEPSR